VSEPACPDCGLKFLDQVALDDHRRRAHDPQYPRLTSEQESGGSGPKIAIAISLLIGVAFVALIVLDAAGVFEKETVPEQPGSEAYGIVREMKQEGSIDEFRAVEPDSGWDIEYELDDGDGALRMREGVPKEAEVEAIFDEDLEEDLEDKLQEHGYLF
jgi:hypothetical protein